MPPRIDYRRCTGAGTCVSVCSANVFDFIDGKGVVMRPKDCTECEECVRACLKYAVTLEHSRGGPPRVLVLYDSVSGRTAALARAIAEGVRQTECSVAVLEASGETMPEVLLADAVLLGSPSQFENVSEMIKGLLGEMRITALADRPSGGFGTYGWELKGEDGIITSGLVDARLATFDRELWVKDDEVEERRDEAVAFGRSFGEWAKGTLSS